MTVVLEPDAVIAEVRAIREELAARHGNDVDRLYQEVKRREQASDRSTLTPAPKRVEPTSVA